MKSLSRAVSLILLISTTAAVPQGQPGRPAGDASAWKPFQELSFLVGSWSGTTDSNGRVGGRVARFTMEMGGNYLVHRGNVIFTAQQGMPEESIEELGYYVYDREKRKYMATYYFSTGVMGIYDVDFPTPGTVRLMSRDLLNYESGGKSRLVLTKKSDTELTHQSDIAPAGKDFVNYITSKMTKK